LGDLEMLLEDGETRTRGYKNLEMLLEDGETPTRGSKTLQIKNFTYPTPTVPDNTPAFLLGIQKQKPTQRRMIF